MLRQKVFYSGNVQGVGFRHAVAYLAGEFSVEGWVRNLPDGRVEMAVQGSPRIVGQFLAKIAAEAPGKVTSHEVQDWTAPLPQSGFHVRFDLNP